jgi:hypothetical protein
MSPLRTLPPLLLAAILVNAQPATHHPRAAKEAEVEAVTLMTTLDLVVMMVTMTLILTASQMH